MRDLGDVPEEVGNDNHYTHYNCTGHVVIESEINDSVANRCDNRADAHPEGVFAKRMRHLLKNNTVDEGLDKVYDVRNRQRDKGDCYGNERDIGGVSSDIVHLHTGNHVKAEFCDQI